MTTQPDLRLIHGTDATPEDEDIKLVARRDKRRAADLVARKYGDRLFRHAVYILKDHQEATDVIQEVFIKAMREKRFFEEDFKIKAWLFRVTSNLCFNIRRDKRRRSAILETVPRARHERADQDQLVFQNQTQAQLFDALQELSEAHRSILMLRYYQDLSYAEIAETLDIKLGTVMSRLSRAKQQLLEVIEGTALEAEHKGESHAL